MTAIEKSIEINAKPETVFDYMKEFEKHAEWMPDVKSHKVTSDVKEGVGVTSHLVTMLVGDEVEMDLKFTEWQEYKKVVWESSEPLKIISAFTLEPTDKGTSVTFSIEYEVPYSFLGKLIDKLKVKKEMDATWTEALKNLKEILEK